MPERDHIWLLWEWSEDAPLVEEFIQRAHQCNLRIKTFTPHEFLSFHPDFQPYNFPYLLWDRAGDVYPEAQCLSDWAEALGSLVINTARGMLLVKDKGQLHRLFLQHHLPVPETQFICSALTLAQIQLDPHRPQVLKPVRSGGGEGVRIHEWTPETLQAGMDHRPGETWLLQEYIEPASIANRPAWFRVFFLLGEVRVCWWDYRTHVYDFIPEAEIQSLGFGDLIVLGARIGRSFPLQFFSTEIAYRTDGQPVVVDYINDPCDLRSAGRVPDGVPLVLLDWIFERMIKTAKSLEDIRL